MTGILELMGHKGVNVAAELAVPFAKRRQHSGRTGDYLEFGTFQGQSLTAFYRAAQKFGVPEMRFFGFDSFEGLPETPTCPPLTEGASETAFLAGNYACSQEELTTILEGNGVDMAKVTLVPGYYNESLSDDLSTELAIDVAGIINIDCDLYESSADALSFVTSLLRSGTILIFDDWLAYDGHPFRGEQRARAKSGSKRTRRSISRSTSSTARPASRSS